VTAVSFLCEKAGCSLLIATFFDSMKSGNVISVFSGGGDFERPIIYGKRFGSVKISGADEVGWRKRMLSIALI
jgi:hypothetical protein